MSTLSCSNFNDCYVQGYNQLNANLSSKNTPSQSSLLEAKASLASACNYIGDLTVDAPQAVHYGVNALKAIAGIQNDFISNPPKGANVSFTNIIQYDVLLAISYLATASGYLYNDNGQTNSVNNAIQAFQQYLDASFYLSTVQTVQATFESGPQTKGNDNLYMAFLAIDAAIRLLDPSIPKS